MKVEDLTRELTIFVLAERMDTNAKDFDVARSFSIYLPTCKAETDYR